MSFRIILKPANEHDGHVSWYELVVKILMSRWLAKYIEKYSIFFEIGLFQSLMSLKYYQFIFFDAKNL